MFNMHTVVWINCNTNLTCRLSVTGWNPFVIATSPSYVCPRINGSLFIKILFSVSVLCWLMQELRERVLRGKYRIPFYMSTDCENLLKRFLVLNPIKRGTLEVRNETRNGLLSFRAILFVSQFEKACWPSHQQYTSQLLLNRGHNHIQLKLASIESRLGSEGTGGVRKTESADPAVVPIFTSRLALCKIALLQRRAHHLLRSWII